MLYVGFVCPHPPLIAPPEFFAWYADLDIPMPDRYAESERPRHPYIEHMRRARPYDAGFTGPEMVKRAIAAYLGSVSFLDYNVGQVLAALERAGLAFRLRLPHVAFNRRIGEFAAIHADTEGTLLSAEQWHAARERMLPSSDDNRYIESLMRPAHAPGAYASWIAPPRIGIDNQPGDFEYVKLEA